MKNYKIVFICLLLVGFVSGCSHRENAQLPQAFLLQPSSVVIAQVSGLEEPDFYVSGGQGLVDIAISRMITSFMREKISEIDSSPVVENYYFKQYGGFLESKFFKVVKFVKPLEKDTLTKFDADDNKHAPYDFRFLKANQNADYAFILQPHAFGVSRPYYGFIPLGAPKGYADLSVYVVDLSDNSIIGTFRSSIEEKVNDEWDNPPEYAALVRACKNALTNTINNAYAFFFQ